MSTLVGDFCGPRARRRIGGPSISSDQAGLSGSLALAELVLGDFKVIARFIFLGLMCISPSLGVDEHNDLTGQETKGNPSTLTVILAQIFACYGEVVPDRFGADEIQAVRLDVALALRLVPGRHTLIVVTKYHKSSFLSPGRKARRIEVHSGLDESVRSNAAQY